MYLCLSACLHLRFCTVSFYLSSRASSASKTLVNFFRLLCVSSLLCRWFCACCWSRHLLSVLPMPRLTAFADVTTAAAHSTHTPSRRLSNLTHERTNNFTIIAMQRPRVEQQRVTNTWSPKCYVYLTLDDVNRYWRLVIIIDKKNSPD